MPTVAELQPGQRIAPFAGNEWLEIAEIRSGEFGAYTLSNGTPDAYRLITFVGDERLARMAPELQVEVQ